MQTHIRITPYCTGHIHKLSAVPIHDKRFAMSMMTMVQVGPVLEAMEDILAALLRSLDGRVYVAVGRGLWDFTSKDIYDYVDSLQEGKENKVGACPCQSLCHLPDHPFHLASMPAIPCTSNLGIESAQCPS